MRSIHFVILTALILMLVLPVNSYSQIIAPSGNPSKAASQLVYYYDQSCNDDFDGDACLGDHQDSVIQVTNTNDTTAVTIHVQIFRSFDPEPGDDGNPPNVICDERNFIDLLTPNDTHVYDLDETNFFKNEGENEANAGERTSIDVNNTKGFVIITPVVSEADLTAIAFEHLIGNTVDNFKFEESDTEGINFRLNAMGRSAVDFATGEILPDGTPLDGVSGGLVLIQPEEIIFDFAEDDDGDVAGFAFSDNYGPAGLLGYQVNPSSVTWTSFVFDYKEDPTSCGIRPINCFDTMGLTEEVDQINEFLDADAEGDDLLCSGVDTANYPDLAGNDPEFDDFGWFRLFISGLESSANHFAVHIADDNSGARWANSNKEDIDVQALQKPSGESTRASSQLIYYYDQSRFADPDETDTGDTTIQLTNTNDTTAVTVHVQIFRTFDPSDDPDADPVFCDERNFIDILTPNDSHVYELDDPNFPKNVGETEAAPGESTSIDVRDTKGFVIITPVVSEADLTAISFQHLIGTSSDDDIEFQMNAVGRDAIDLTTGQILADGTPLDGVSTGFVLLQPEELLVDFAVSEDEEDTDDFGSINEADIVGIAFDDSYGPAGLLGYNIVPATVNWTSFIFDFKEDPTSCGNRTVNCFLTVGLNDTITQNNIELNSFVEPESEPGDLLCAGTETPPYPNTDDMELEHFGWVRIFTTGLGDRTNHLGFFILGDFVNDEDDATQRIEGADLMYAKGEEVFPDVEPPAEDCAVEGDEDEDGFADCLDTDCATDESCETGEEECADEMDNDEDGDTDCADLGCDGFAGCEFGEEVSCDDGIDNDADGAVDGDDTDCQEETTGGDGGDGGGCVVTGTVSTSSSVVNFLVLMLPFIGVFGIRRIRKRN